MKKRLIAINANYRGISNFKFRIQLLKSNIRKFKYFLFVLLPIKLNNNELPDFDSLGLNKKYWILED